MNLLDLINATSARKEQQDEQRRQEAQETQTLRKLMSLYDPANKDSYTSMGLGDLRGVTQGFALKKTLSDIGLNDARANEISAQVDEIKARRRSAKSLREAIRSAGTDTGTFDFPGSASSFMGEIKSPVSVPLTTKRLRSVLPMYPDAVNAPDFPQTMNSLENLMSDPEAGMIPGQPSPIPGAPSHFFVPLSKGSGTVIKTDTEKTGTVYNDPEVVPKQKPPKGFQWIWDGDKWKMASERAENPYAGVFNGPVGGAAPAASPSQSPDYEWRDGKLIRLSK